MAPLSHLVQLSLYQLLTCNNEVVCPKAIVPSIKSVWFKLSLKKHIKVNSHCLSLKHFCNEAFNLAFGPWRLTALHPNHKI